MITVEMIGNRIREERERKGYSQNELADALKKYDIEISRETLSKIETGSRSISAIEIKAICKVFGLDAEVFLSEEEDENLVTLFRREIDIDDEIVLEEISQVHDMIKAFVVQKNIFLGNKKYKPLEPIWRT